MRLRSATGRKIVSVVWGAGDAGLVRLARIFLARTAEY